MSTIPVPPTPPKEERVPELSALDINKLMTEYVAQIKYYENIKTWKVYMRKELWKFVKAKQYNYSQDDLYDYISKGVRDNILTIVERD